MTATQFTALFVFALAANVALKFWLAYRQLGHVAAHRAEVPAAFHGKVDLAAHQKAADYTRAMVHLDMLSVLFETLVLFAFTGRRHPMAPHRVSGTLSGPCCKAPP